MRSTEFNRTFLYVVIACAELAEMPAFRQSFAGPSTLRQAQGTAGSGSGTGRARVMETLRR